MQKIYCRKCGSEILRKNILGIGHFNENIGEYKGRSFVAFRCPVCKKVRYQFLDDKLPASKDKLIEGKLKNTKEKKQLLTARKIDINQVISFYEKLKDIDKVDDLLKLLD
ncbi:MAG: hypothetical protein ACQEQD_03205 [Bacillota bacterium]